MISDQFLPFIYLFIFQMFKITIFWIFFYARSFRNQSYRPIDYGCL